AALTIEDQSALAKIEVRSKANGAVADKLQTNFGRTYQGDEGTLVIGSGPGQWHVISEVGSQATALAELQQLGDGIEELTTAVDLTHGRALFRLTGEEGAELLNKICALELSDDVVPNGSALRSSVGGVVTDIARNDRNGTRSYLLHCERSAGQYLWDTLLDAGAEYRIEEAGFSAG